MLRPSHLVETNVMKKLFACSLLSFVLLPLAIVAQQPQDTKEKEIREVEELERVAVLKEDVTSLERIWSEQFIVNNPQNEISADRTAVFDRIKKGLISYAQFDRKIESIKFSDDIAVVMGSETVLRKGDTAAQTIHRRFTNIWKQSGKTWQLIARHASVICPRN